ncbi:extracellular solute-binding protein [Butyrivibrio sp. MB2005]|uniref:extracellular solute-binding protein n=1 Tax=Butyrivibrio sp. MB2005 TaxID=1280678 RepID=UPI0003FC1058|nr:extracellular solute-binding protein [Butyrivibrio sp. MB2005]
MKSKMIKKILGCTLVTSMVFSLAACGGNSSSAGSAVSTENESDSEAATSDNSVKDFNIFAGISALSADNAEKPVVQKMNENMGVTVNWNCVSGDTLTEKKNLILNAGGDELPDALMGADLTDYEIITNGTNGIFIPLENYINEETTPNLMKLIEERPELLATCTMPDGHIYSLPNISEMGFDYKDGKQYFIGAIPQFMAINKTWLDNLGLQMPTTIDELHDVLTAFKENDCNGNGDTTDEIPLSFEWGHWCANMTSLFSAFGFTDYNADHRAIQDGKVYFQAATDNYKDAMEYFHNWYTEGLIDSEVFSQTDSQYIAKGADDRLGVFAWWEIPEVAGDHADEYEYLTFLSGADGKIGVNLNEQGTTGHGLYAITSACKNPELLMKWVDQVYDPITSMQIIYGPIGEYFEDEPDAEGFYVEKPEAGGDLKARLEFKAPSRQLNSDFQTYYHMEDRAQQRLDDLANVWFEKVTNFESYPSVVYTLEETETINEFISDIDEYVKETSAGWITGGGADEEFDAYVKQLEDMGMNDVVAAWQSAYDRYEEAAK